MTSYLIPHSEMMPLAESYAALRYVRGQNAEVVNLAGCYAYIYDRLNAKQIPNFGYLGKTE